jgi:DNA-binding LytR/AlgR family response regulator
VDDEYLAIKVLEDYVSRTDELTLAASFKNPEEALTYLQDNPVDLLFLDIQMPRLDGFALLSQLKEPPLVIFTTARHDYALKAFDLNVLDYLAKPISFVRFQQAVNKAKELLKYRQLAEKDQQAEDQFLTVNADYSSHKIPYAAILYIEGFGEYVKIFTEKKSYITLASLKSMEETLPDMDFYRVHKSYIVKAKEIASFNHQKISLSCGKEIAVGRSFRKAFLTKMKG